MPSIGQPPRVLVVRPADEAAATLSALAEAGMRGISAPVLQVLPRTLPSDIADGAGAVALTSANAARAAAGHAGLTSLPALCVGSATAAAARAAGFSKIESAEGDATALAALIVRRPWAPGKGSVVYLSGATVAHDLAALVAAAGGTAAGVQVRRIVAYAAEPVGRLPDAARAALAGDDLDGVLLTSARTAEVLIALASQAGLTDHFARIAAIAISPAVMAAASSTPWHAQATAATPDLSALIAAARRTLLGDGDSVA